MIGQTFSIMYLNLKLPLKMSDYDWESYSIVGDLSQLP
jgi:hypothetical protein